MERCSAAASAPSHFTGASGKPGCPFTLMELHGRGLPPLPVTTDGRDLPTGENTGPPPTIRAREVGRSISRNEN